MSMATYYQQECPTCGRPLQVRVKLLGKQVVCPHCRRRFEARDPANQMGLPDPDTLALMERVNRLLATADKRPQRPAGPGPLGTAF